jgi:hypothetical protein
MRQGAVACVGRLDGVARPADDARRERVLALQRDVVAGGRVERGDREGRDSRNEGGAEELTSHRVSPFYSVVAATATGLW